MKFFKKLFQKGKSKEIPTTPPWAEVVEMMHDKSLDAFAIEVVRVMYSVDKTMRYVVLKDEKGLFTYQLEAIHQFDEEEWKYIFSNDGTLPATWEPFGESIGKSFFENEEELLKEMKAEAEYKQYFE